MYVCIYIFQTKIDLYSLPLIVATRISGWLSMMEATHFYGHIAAPLTLVTVFKCHRLPGGPSDSVEMSSTRCLGEL